MAKQVDVKKLTIRKQDFLKDLKKASQRIEKPKASPEPSKT